MYYNTLIPYAVLPHLGIQYGVCRDFSHISRYRRLRQVVHCPQDLEDRFVSLETPNPFSTHAEVVHYEVPPRLENRLDLIAYEVLGNANYSWVISYFNGISDGFTAPAGQKLVIPKSFTALYSKGEILASVSPLTLNLGTE